MGPRLLGHLERKTLLDLMEANRSHLNGTQNEIRKANDEIFEGFLACYPERDQDLTQKQIREQCCSIVRRLAIELPGSWDRFAALGKDYIKAPLGNAPNSSTSDPGNSRELPLNDEISETVEPVPDLVPRGYQSQQEPLPTHDNGRSNIDGPTTSSLSVQAIQVLSDPHFLNDADISNKLLSTLEASRQLSRSYAKSFHRSGVTDTLLNFAASMSMLGSPLEIGPNIGSDNALMLAVICQILYAWVYAKKPDAYDDDVLFGDLKVALEKFDRGESAKVVAIQQKMQEAHLRSKRFWDNTLHYKAEELTSRLQNTLNSIFSSTSQPAQPLHFSQDMATTLSRQTKGLFVEAIKLRVQLRLKEFQGHHCKLSWPRRGDEFDENTMAAEGGVKTTRSTKVYITLTPAVTKGYPHQHDEEAGIFVNQIVLARARVYVREPLGPVGQILSQDG